MKKKIERNMGVGRQEHIWRTVWRMIWLEPEYCMEELYEIRLKS